MGVSKIVSKAGALSVTRVGTPLYLSPELIKQQPYDFKVDIWALGCVLYHVSCLETPFHGDNLITLGYNIVHKNPKIIPNIFSAKLANFIMKLLEKFPNSRPSSKELVEIIGGDNYKKVNSKNDKIYVANNYFQEILIEPVEAKKNIEKIQVVSEKCPKKEEKSTENNKAKIKISSSILKNNFNENFEGKIEINKRNNNIIEDFQSKVKDNDYEKGNLKENLQNKIKDDCKDKKKDNIKDNTKENLQDRIKDNIKNNKKDDLIINLQDKIKDNLKENMQDKINDIYKDNKKENLKENLQEIFKDKDNLKDETKDDLIVQEKVKDKDKIKFDLKDKINDNIKENLQDKSKYNFKDNLKDKIKYNIEDKGKDKSKENLEDQIKNNVKENMKNHLKGNLKNIVKENVEENLQDKMKNNLKDKVFNEKKKGTIRPNSANNKNTFDFKLNNQIYKNSIESYEILQNNNFFKNRKQLNSQKFPNKIFFGFGNIYQKNEKNNVKNTLVRPKSAINCNLIQYKSISNEDKLLEIKQLTKKNKEINIDKFEKKSEILAKSDIKIDQISTPQQISNFIINSYRISEKKANNLNSNNFFKSYFGFGSTSGIYYIFF